MSETQNWTDPEYYLQQLNPALFILYMKGVDKELRRNVNVAHDCAEHMVRYADPNHISECAAIAQGRNKAIIKKGQNTIVTFADLGLNAAEYQGPMNSSSFYGDPKRAQQVAEITLKLIEGILSTQFEIAQLE